MRTLAEVRHVPDMKKNLSSLGALDSESYKFSAEGGVMKVVKGTLVLMRSNRVGNLYILFRNSVIGGAVGSSSDDNESVSTGLWHLRMGHMSEEIDNTEQSKFVTSHKDMQVRFL